ncbi:MAG: hypothetical protein ACQETI_00055 [Halobacteriota archaeon]
MPSRYERAVDVTLDSLALAVVPVVATLLSFSKVARVLAADPGGGAVFPFPTGLPTLWTYVSIPSSPGGGSVGEPLSLVAFVPLFLLGLLFTSALEAGFLGALLGRIDDAPVTVLQGARKFTLRIVGVNLVRAAIVVAAFPLLVFPPLALMVVVVLSYLVYGLPFVVVVNDVGVRTALDETVRRALDGGAYAEFGIAHLAVGAAASFFMTSLVRNNGLVGVMAGTLLVAGPSVFVATYGLLTFREFRGATATHPTVPR